MNRNNNYIICFLILHFGDPKVTFKLIDSLLKLNDISYSRIIVLDNGSNNESYQILKDKYERNVLIELYKSDNNLGFSSGNNFMYSKSLKYNPRFVIALNNDVEIKDKGFINKLLSINCADIYVIGPDIYNPHICAHQNPAGSSYQTADDIKKTIEILKKYNSNSFLHYLKKNMRIIVKIKQKIVGMLHNRIIISLVSKVADKLYGRSLNTLYLNKYFNPLFDGSCLIFTKKYIENETKLFEPDSFFYGEELLLALKCHTLKYRTLYTPELKVIHHSRVSTKKVMDENEIVNKQIKACEFYLDVYKNNIWKKRLLK